MLTFLRRRLAAAAADERGFAMVPVIIALAISSMLVVAAVSTAMGDLPAARNSQDRKLALSAAEAGLNYYQFHLNLDPDYWTKCDQVADPNPSDPNDNSPVALAGANPRKWRTVPGTTSAYAIELIPAPGRTCAVGDQTSMLSSGTFKIRVTGRANGLYRTVLATFRRAGFLDFVYLTNFETLDPDADSSSSSTVATCSKLRSQRPSACSTISFRTGDQLKGPMHTNDESIAVCGAPSFGRTNQSPKDRVDVNAASGTGWFNNGSCGAGPPVFNTSSGALGINGGTISFPSQNNALETSAANGGLVFRGKTTIVLNGNQATVTNAKQSPTTKTYALGSGFNGVIYVKDDPAAACTTTDRPTVAKYTVMQTQCAEATVYGSYTTSMTIASQRDIIVQPQSGTNNGILRPAGDPSTLGLIANGFVRVYHSVNVTGTSPRTCTNNGYVGDVEIDAAILSLQHSFINDNHDCGGHLGTLTIKGAIAQNFRGTVGLVDGTGYTKDYNYDDRLKYRNPPFFLPPLNAAWSVGRENEQVPARKGP